MSEKKRIFSVDFCCVIGLILMLGFHFFQRSGIQDVPVATGAAGIAIHSLRWLCMAGYPLILMLSGAVFLREEFSYTQYRGFAKILYCVVIGFFAVKYLGGAEVGAMNNSVPIYHYSGIEFAELYAFILLASPFLNCAYQGLPNNKARFALIAVMSVITSLPDMLIINDMRLISGMFRAFYPVTIYFIGAYIYDNRKNSDMLSSFVLLISMCLAQAIFSYTDTVNNGGIFMCKRLDSYASLAVIISAGAIFSMFCNINIKGAKIRCVFRELSRCAMIIIMLCGYAENKVLIELLDEMQDFSYMKYFIPYLCIIVILMFAGAFVFMLPFTIVRMMILKNREEQSEYADEEYSDEEYSDDSDDEELSDEEDEAETDSEYEEENSSEYEAESAPASETEIEDATEAVVSEKAEIHYEEKKEVKLPPLKPKKPATFDSVMTEYTKGYHSATPPDDVDKLIELIMSGK